MIFDIEGDSLEPTKLHVLSASYVDGEIASTPDYETMKIALEREETLVGHNIIRFDIPVLERLVGYKPKETLLVDTLALSWILYPERNGREDHSLDSWGETLGIKKPEIDDWEGLSYEEYRHRCEEDVRITNLLWKRQYSYLRLLYGSNEGIKSFLRYIQFKMYCARLAEERPWRIDVKKVYENYDRLYEIRQRKILELRDILPPVPVVKKVSEPKVLYKRGGELSSHGLKWKELVESRGLPWPYRGTIEVVTGYDPPNPGSHQQVKDYLFSLGWKPDVFKENKKGIKVPQINKKKQDGGGVCDSIVALYVREPRLEVLDNVYVLAHRLGILEGFKAAERRGGYLRAGVQGFTNTLRFKHAILVNLPKPDAKFGREIRECMIARDGHELCGADMSSLEDRTKQHYMWPYDPDYVKEMMKPGFDPHLDLALSAGKVTEEQVHAFKTKQDVVTIYTTRGVFKNTNYACTYGAGAAKVAETAGVSQHEGKELHEAYWKRNWSLKEIPKKWKVRKMPDGKEWILNPVSGFWYWLKNPKDRFSTVNQSTGVFCFDVWIKQVVSIHPHLLGQFHDEITREIPIGQRAQEEGLLNQALKETNEILELNRELGIGIAWGQCYADIH